MAATTLFCIFPPNIPQGCVTMTATLDLKLAKRAGTVVALEEDKDMGRLILRSNCFFCRLDL